MDGGILRDDPPVCRSNSMKHNYFDEAMSYGNLRKALLRCCRNIRWKDSVVGYELHAPQNTHKRAEEIRSGKYKVSPYQHFTIWEPKKRDIVATRIADRQVQMALCETGLYQDLTEHFIYDNCACQKGKGTDFALKRLKVHMLRYYREHGKEGWVLKCDVHHFFPSTRHDVAKEAAAKRISDPKALKMVCEIIDSFDGDEGIGLGSQISQLIELSVLDDIDHIIKERLRVKHYIRYMDDFILIHPDKEYLKYCLTVIGKELAKIHLELNEKTSIYPLKQGVKFLQWRFVITNTGGVRMFLGKDKSGRERRRLRKLAKKEMDGSVQKGTVDQSFISWKANADRGNTFYQVRRMAKFRDSLERMIEDGNESGKSAKGRT